MKITTRVFLGAMFFSAVCVASVGSECVEAKDCYEMGDQHFAAGNLLEAERYFESAVAKGDTGHAGFALGVCYAEEGEYDKAITAFTAACKAGYQNACDNLPNTKKLVTSLNGIRQGVAKNWVQLGSKRMEARQFETAAGLFAKACQRRYAPGCTKLGEAEDVLDRKEAAKQHLQEGCNGKDQEGCRLLGIFIYRGGDRALARKYFEQGCKAKHYPSCGFLGGLELKAGKVEAGVALLEEACKNKVVDACESLAFHYGKSKEDRKAKQTIARIKDLLTPDCKAGKNDACRRLASLK